MLRPDAVVADMRFEFTLRVLPYRPHQGVRPWLRDILDYANEPERSSGVVTYIDTEARIDPSMLDALGIERPHPHGVLVHVVNSRYGMPDPFQPGSSFGLMSMPRIIAYSADMVWDQDARTWLKNRWAREGEPFDPRPALLVEYDVDTRDLTIRADSGTDPGATQRAQMLVARYNAQRGRRLGVRR